MVVKLNLKAMNFECQIISKCGLRPFSLPSSLFVYYNNFLQFVTHLSRVYCLFSQIYVEDLNEHYRLLANLTFDFLKDKRGLEFI